MLFQIINVNFVPCSWHVDYIISHNNMYYTEVMVNGAGYLLSCKVARWSANCINSEGNGHYGKQFLFSITWFSQLCTIYMCSLPFPDAYKLLVCERPLNRTRLRKSPSGSFPLLISTRHWTAISGFSKYFSSSFITAVFLVTTFRLCRLVFFQILPRWQTALLWL